MATMEMPGAVDLRGVGEKCETTTVSAPPSFWREVNARRGPMPRAPYMRGGVLTSHALQDLADGGDGDCQRALAKVRAKMAADGR